MEVVKLLLLLLATDEVIDEGSIRLLKGVDGSRLQARTPLLSCLFESRRERLIEDSIKYPLEEYCCLKSLQMIDRIGGPIVDLELEQLEVLREWLLHYPQSKGWLTIESLVGLCRGVIVKSILDLLIYPLIECPEPSFDGKISNGAGLRILRKMVIRD